MLARLEARRESGQIMKAFVPLKDPKPGAFRCWCPQYRMLTHQ